MAAIYISNFRNFRAARQRGNPIFMRHPFLTFSFLLILTLPVWLTLAWYGQRAAIQLEAQRELQEAHSLEWLSLFPGTKLKRSFAGNTITNLSGKGACMT
jgi:hypothetical protein